MYNMVFVELNLFLECAQCIKRMVCYITEILYHGKALVKLVISKYFILHVHLMHNMVFVELNLFLECAQCLTRMVCYII